jgi:nucleoside-diphosphate-sugar epimerase
MGGGMNLFVFGIGYTAGHYLRLGTAFTEAAGTVRSPERAAELRRGGTEAFVFDGRQADAAVAARLRTAELCLVSAQPGAAGDPVLAAFGDQLAEAPRLSRIVYLSTIGVYGDHGGAWIDESTPPRPQSERGRARLGVERDWLALPARAGKMVLVLRLAGSYGPGRNALVDLASGEARCIDKPGQVFNRIHVADIARTIDRAFAFAGESTAWNVADDEPAAAAEVVAFAASLMGRAPPPRIPFAQAELTPMARSFYGANRRVANAAVKQRLGVQLAYPTYREGLAALWNAGEGRVAPAPEAC